MATPSLFPLFLKAQDAVVPSPLPIGGAGTVYIETLEIEVMPCIEVEVVDDTISVEVLDLIEVVIEDDPIDIEVCD